MEKQGLHAFQRRVNDVFCYMGTGELGEKASGLIGMYDILNEVFRAGSSGDIEVYIPQSLVILSDVFEQFMNENDLWELATADVSETQIAQLFLKASLPALLSGDLYEYACRTTYPLAVRSSSILEDSLNEPFAGIYHTKMLPNWYQDPQQRFQKLSAS
jgi:phosphoenolpyruvate synthase/pyruvate phosphate dikinase